MFTSPIVGEEHLDEEVIVTLTNGWSIAAQGRDTAFIYAPATQLVTHVKVNNLTIPVDQVDFMHLLSIRFYLLRDPNANGGVTWSFEKDGESI